MSESRDGIVMDVEDRTSLYESLADAKKSSPVNMRRQKGETGKAMALWQLVYEPCITWANDCNLSSMKVQ